MNFYLRKLSRLQGQCCSTARLVIDPFYVKYCAVLTQYYKIDLLIGINFFSEKKYIFSSFLSNFMRPKTYNKLSVNIDHV